MNSPLSLLAFVAALGCGLNSGIFFVFSNFVMRALARLPAAQGIAAMQAINVTVINPGFFLVFFGTGVLCLPIAVLASRDSGAGKVYLLAACAVYLVGSIGVTIAGNVPLNDELAAVDANADSSTQVWERYLSRWTLWNHIRTAACLAACGLFIRALL